MTIQNHTLGSNNGEQFPDLELGTYEAVLTALDVGYRHFDCACIGEAFAMTTVPRNKYYVTSKLWNNCYRPEDVGPALEATLAELKRNYLDLYLMHAGTQFWPQAFKSGNEEFPMDAQGRVISEDVSFVDTWKAMEKLILDNCKTVPAVNQVELHLYLLREKLLQFSKKHNNIITAYSPLGGPRSPGVTDEPLIREIAKRLHKSPAQVLLSWGVRRGTVVVPKSANPARIKANLELFELSKEDFEAINELSRKKIRYCFPEKLWSGVAACFEDD
ncbi:Aldo/keto reductase [Basidiobolus meristosporus CBS 931.73]|uniref:Aldo/keto reductase n=1 Tax=Basidiobolus meristosporus CBS 931.73 TaxID=1314790 RepID=A0A1Y1XBY4_9FUNG|nr:Aldo/keto reductase [Basidiobolus meristosporus CBS 931.73]|eukprot:ORX83248.1 Aldo/keto reductase [Basidiobolus meristosporus CBS 931.73]